MSEQTATYTHKPIDEMESIWRGIYFRARGELGIEGFGLGVMSLPPDFDRIARHNHTFDGQEEVYIPIAGSGWIDIGNHRVPLDAGMAVRVGPTASRTVISGPDGLRVAIVGGTPGKAYEAFEPLDKGAPEPDPKELPGIKAEEFHESTEDYAAIPLEGSGAFRGQLPGITFYPIGRALGVTSFGLAVLDIDPSDPESHYPRHSHDLDKQEEVYIVVRGSGRIEIEDDAIEVGAGEMVSVGPGASRKWHAGKDGLRLVAIGAPAGQAYSGNNPTQL